MRRGILRLLGYYEKDGSIQRLGTFHLSYVQPLYYIRKDLCYNYNNILLTIPINPSRNLVFF